MRIEVLFEFVVIAGAEFPVLRRGIGQARAEIKAALRRIKPFSFESRLSRADPNTAALTPVPLSPSMNKKAPKDTKNSCFMDNKVAFFIDFIIILEADTMHSDQNDQSALEIFAELIRYNQYISSYDSLDFSIDYIVETMNLNLEDLRENQNWNGQTISDNKISGTLLQILHPVGVACLKLVQASSAAGGWKVLTNNFNAIAKLANTYSVDMVAMERKLIAALEHWVEAVEKFPESQRPLLHEDLKDRYTRYRGLDASLVLKYGIDSTWALRSDLE